MSVYDACFPSPSRLLISLFRMYNFNSRYIEYFSISLQVQVECPKSNFSKLKAILALGCPDRHGFITHKSLINSDFQDTNQFREMKSSVHKQAS